MAASLNMGKGIVLAVIAGAFLVSLLLSQQPVEGKGVAAIAPPRWDLNRSVLAQGGPIAFNNFGSRYARGGAVPPGGAEIDITSVPASPMPVRDLMQKELDGANIRSMQEESAAGSAGLRAIYADTFGPLQCENVAVYLVRGTRIFKFFLTFRSGDPRSTEYIEQFNRLLATARFTQ